MAILSLLLLLQQGAPSPPDPSPNGQRLVVREAGVFLTEVPGNTVPPSAPQPPPAAVQGLRWQVDDMGLGWTGRHVAMGASGSWILAGLEAQSETVSAYPASSPTPLFNFSVPGAFAVRPAVAQREGSLVAMATFDLGFFSYQSTVYFWDLQQAGTPAWSFDMPLTGNVSAGFCGISEDGSRIVAVVENTNGTHHIRVLDDQGSILHSYDLPTASFLRQAAIDTQANRLYLGLFNGTCEIYDLQTGILLHSRSLGGSFESHAFSGDGKTFAYGNLVGLFVIREVSPGVWSTVAQRISGGLTYVAYTALNADGSRCGYAVQHYVPAFDRVQVGMWDVETDTEMFVADQYPHGTTLQFSASGLAIDDAGDYLASINWGDSLQLIPEVSVYDSLGNLTASVHTTGSALSVAMDPDGEVIAVGTKADHVTLPGDGGSVLAVDTYEQDLHVMGFPQLGGILDFVTPDGANEIGFAASTGLAPSSSPFGTIDLDLSQLIALTAKHAIPSGGLTLPYLIPNDPSLLDATVHVQGLRFGAGIAFTNKVSVRLVP